MVCVDQKDLWTKNLGPRLFYGDSRTFFFFTRLQGYFLLRVQYCIQL